MHQWIITRLAGWGLALDTARTATDLVEVVLVAGIACLAYYLTNRVFLRIIQSVALKTRVDWDDRLVQGGLFRRLAHVVPAIVIHVLAPTAFSTEWLVTWARRGADIYAILAALATATQFLTVCHEFYQELEVARRFPIRVYVQVVKILLAATAIVLCISVALGQPPLLLLSGLGAMTAVLLLISKDSIQGLLAGIQLVSNDLVRPGDWIEMAQYGADGDVEDITLLTVKVRNFDNTITSIPSYALVSQSFKNWRGMKESEGRRIKRSILVDISSVQFCTREMIEGLMRIDLIRDYLRDKSSEMEEHNLGRSADVSEILNGRRLTNLGVFRQYAISYLRAHQQVNQDLTLMVRQLQPTEHGVPLQLYTFSLEKRWVPYEGIQSDIFDHLFASLHRFGLRAYQMPSGYDAARALAALGT